MLNLDPQALVLKLVVLALLLLIALPFHEFAHAFAAYRLGDSTARLFGRLTLDPRAHLDPVGALMLTFTVLAGLGFGWAKPTPINPLNLRYGRWGEAIVAAAGPISNLILATVAAIPFRIALAAGIDSGYVLQVLYYFVFINILLLIFNLIPIPPLDGSKVLYAFLDQQTAWRVRPMLEQYGPLLLLLLILLPAFGGANPLGTVFTSIADPLLTLLTGIG